MLLFEVLVSFLVKFVLNSYEQQWGNFDVSIYKDLQVLKGSVSNSNPEGILKVEN